MYYIMMFVLQTFLSELYVYLVDQMHVGLNKVLAVEDQSAIPDPLTDSAQLKHFAREAEVNENFVLAAKYYQEVRQLIQCQPYTYIFLTFDYIDRNLCCIRRYFLHLLPHV